MAQNGPKHYLTRRGYDEISREMRMLQTDERPRVVQEVADAAAQGDRSENAEYIYGKKRLREIDRRLRFLNKILTRSTIVDPREQSGDTVYFGATVVVEDDDGNEDTYQIVGVEENDPSQGRISYRSPIGAALLGKALDDEVQIRVPSGVKTLCIVDVRYE